MSNIEPYTRFSKSLSVSHEQAALFAEMAGDSNPIHHDPHHAKQLGFEDLTLSGAQSTSLLMGLIADYFSRIGPMVGLEFEIFFKKPALSKKLLELEWLIVRNTPKPRINAQLIELRGRLKMKGRETAVGAKGKVLVYN